MEVFGLMQQIYHRYFTKSKNTFFANSRGLFLDVFLTTYFTQLCRFIKAKISAQKQYKELHSVLTTNKYVFYTKTISCRVVLRFVNFRILCAQSAVQPGTRCWLLRPSHPLRKGTQ
jgi:hypothetical protein